MGYQDIFLLVPIHSDARKTPIIIRSITSDSMRVKVVVGIDVSLLSTGPARKSQNEFRPRKVL